MPERDGVPRIIDGKSSRHAAFVAGGCQKTNFAARRACVVELPLARHATAEAVFSFACFLCLQM